jgi:hypothetical protein
LTANKHYPHGFEDRINLADAVPLPAPLLIQCDPSNVCNLKLKNIANVLDKFVSKHIEHTGIGVSIMELGGRPRPPEKEEVPAPGMEEDPEKGRVP